MQTHMWFQPSSPFLLGNCIPGFPKDWRLRKWTHLFSPFPEPHSAAFPLVMKYLPVWTQPAFRLLLHTQWPWPQGRRSEPCPMQHRQGQHLPPGSLPNARRAHHGEAGCLQLESNETCFALIQTWMATWEVTTREKKIILDKCVPLTEENKLELCVMPHKFQFLHLGVCLEDVAQDDLGGCENAAY